MNTWTVMRRILTQFRRDKRSMALMIMAPILVLTLMWLVLDSEQDELDIAIIDVPEPITDQFSDKDTQLTRMTKEGAEEELSNQSLDAIIEWQDDKPVITVEGSDPNTTSSIHNLIQQSLRSPDTIQPEIEFWHGSSNLDLFDYIGPVLIGFFVFFFVFIVGGVSFLRERTQGTLERILSTPLKRSELVMGYLSGFGLFTILQSVLIAAYSIYVLDVFMDGNFFYVLLVTFLLALSALSLGTLLSAFAKNEFQMIQFIPLVIVPQVFFSGLFPIEGLSDWLQAIGKIMPLTYGADALRGIMLRGESFLEFQTDLYVLLGFIVLFTVLNIAALKRYRKL
ncbi:ABC transporter permease [Halobacillus sp. Marseille-Q1614]|uniref:ABC transporter permease n=1 Tax=Halobacillus sp. Marseille-Q1614 TaxID=2709134 RepID=UPI00157092F3|nr:ABC transporter permease [Halobacillus sp. Marseille-Q1614]